MGGLGDLAVVDLLQGVDALAGGVEGVHKMHGEGGSADWLARRSGYAIFVAVAIALPVQAMRLNYVDSIREIESRSDSAIAELGGFRADILVGTVRLVVEKSVGRCFSRFCSCDIQNFLVEVDILRSPVTLAFFGRTPWALPAQG